MREYRIAKGWAIFIYVTATLMNIVFLFVLGYGILHPDEDAMLFFGVVSVPMIILMTVGIIDTAKSKLIITNTSIGKRSFLSNRDIPISEVLGFRSDDKYTYIEPKDKTYKKIRFGKSLEKRQEIFEWLYSNFKDLDELSKEIETQEILSSEDFGRNVEEREEQLGLAKKVATGINIFGGGVGVYTLFVSEPYELCIIFSILTPLIALAILPFFKGLIRINEQKGSAYPTIYYAILAPSIGLMGRAYFDFNIYDYSNFWVPFVVIALLLLGASLAVSNEFNLKENKHIGALFGLALFFLMYSGGAIVTTNCYYDESEAINYKAEIIQKTVHTGKTTTYKFELTPWGDQIEPETVTVSEEFYEQMESGNTVNVYYLKGYFNIPWLVVTE
ncbi:hypothetical protein [Flammeovirga sp. EKP202]|uniref:hypothetical protein n=1 Tax=Flammeovirga sp. EKP202 TaxID=2770592 RepID=UPI00165FEA6E|nr:hypothetical protein [Flammeovirga sp. EKP202]MBD0404439.1 hypothetical protein [Flammeovirga sp. EKP202]